MPEESNKFWESLKLPFALVMVLWVVHGIEIILGLNLGQFGVYPRSFKGILGIFTSPFIHGDLSHLISNSIPLFALSGIIIYFYRTVAHRSMLMIYVLTGISVWFLARPVFHIGASGVVYGLVAFIFWSGIFRRNVKSIVLALIVLFFWGGMFAGIVPNQEGISWESHLIGGFVGLFTSFYYKAEIEEDEVERPPSWANEVEDPNRPHFLPRDIFDKTKVQRWEEEQERLRRKNDDSDGWIVDDTF